MGEYKLMRNKILPILIVALLSFTSVIAIAADNESSDVSIFVKEDQISFSQATFETKDDHLSINVVEANTFLKSPGKPILPVYVKTLEFPFGTKIKGVDVTFSDIKQQVIPSKIIPASNPTPLISANLDNNDDQIIEDSSVYSSSSLYPDKWYEYSIGCGLDKTEHVIILTIRCYPVRYAPAEDTIQYIENLDVKVTYEEGQGISPLGEQYDMVIITPKRFESAALPLKEHKDQMGLPTIIKTTESIYKDYTGRDEPEKIKYFIKDAIETYDIKYVLLLGGKQGQSRKWYVPARYSNLEDKASGEVTYWNETYASDLYYADIYRYNETSAEYEFDDWDSNGNGKFAEWTWEWNSEYGGFWNNTIDQKDVLDLCPDVYAGRLACNNIFDVRTVVNKIINYEKNTYGESWFKKMIIVGGDTVIYENDPDPVNEGELETGLGASYIEPLGFEINKLWASNGKLESSTDVIEAVSDGAGFLYFSGHGSPAVWSTHPTQNDGEWIDALATFQMARLRNNNELPICIVGGCHNSEFDVSLFNFIDGLRHPLKYFSWAEDQNCFGKMAWVPRCWSWNLVRQKNGGSIATIGNTGLGWGDGGEACTASLDGWITSHFFQVYYNLRNLDNCTLGMVHGQTISEYITSFDPDNSIIHDTDNRDEKTVEQWILLGDPSLKIGGYP